MFKTAQTINDQPVFIQFVSSGFGEHDFQIISRALDRPARVRFNNDRKLIRAYGDVAESVAQSAYDDYKSDEDAKFEQWLKDKNIPTPPAID